MIHSAVQNGSLKKTLLLGSTERCPKKVKINSEIRDEALES